MKVAVIVNMWKGEIEDEQVHLSMFAPQSSVVGIFPATSYVLIQNTKAINDMSVSDKSIHLLSSQRLKSKREISTAAIGGHSNLPTPPSQSTGQLADSHYDFPTIS